MFYFKEMKALDKKKTDFLPAMVTGAFELRGKPLDVHFIITMQNNKNISIVYMHVRYVFVFFLRDVYFEK